MTGRISALVGQAQPAEERLELRPRPEVVARADAGPPSPRSKARRQNTQPSTRSGWMSLVSLIGK